MQDSHIHHSSTVVIGFVWDHAGENIATVCEDMTTANDLNKDIIDALGSDSTIRLYHLVSQHGGLQ